MPNLPELISAPGLPQTHGKAIGHCSGLLHRHGPFQLAPHQEHRSLGRAIETSSRSLRWRAGGTGLAEWRFCWQQHQMRKGICWRGSLARPAGGIAAHSPQWNQGWPHGQAALEPATQQNEQRLAKFERRGISSAGKDLPVCPQRRAADQGSSGSAPSVSCQAAHTLGLLQPGSSGSVRHSFCTASSASRRPWPAFSSA